MSTVTSNNPIAPIDLVAERASLGKSLEEAVLQGLDVAVGVDP